MSDGWYETIAAIGGLTAVAIYALYEGSYAIAEMATGSLAIYLGAKAVAARAPSSSSPPG